MRTPYRDRCRSLFVAFCITLVITLVATTTVAALSADYIVYPNGTAYQAFVEVTDTDSYQFADVGALGEQIPLNAGDINLVGNCSPCKFNSTPQSFMNNIPGISFEKGNYTVSFVAPLNGNHLQAVFEDQYQINVTLPEEFDVRNPLLASLSPGANVTRYPDNTTSVRWDSSNSFDMRFYNQGQEVLLYYFLQFMAILVIVFVVIPYVMMREKE
jgi:hypothetical protein